MSLTSSLFHIYMSLDASFFSLNLRNWYRIIIFILSNEGSLMTSTHIYFLIIHYFVISLFITNLVIHIFKFISKTSSSRMVTCKAGLHLLLLSITLLKWRLHPLHLFRNKICIILSIYHLLIFFFKHLTLIL